MAKIEKINGVSNIIAEPGDNGTYVVKGIDKNTNTYTEKSIDINVAPGSFTLMYNIPAAGKYQLFYEKVSPTGNENTISVFPQGTIGKLSKVGQTGVVEIELYHETTSKADTCFEYEFTVPGVYTLTVDNWVGNTNDPGVHNPDDLGKGVYAQMLRGSKIPNLMKVVGFAFPSNTASFYSMFNSCTATGHMPSVMCDCVTRPTDMFDSAKFETIGNVIFKNAWKPQTSGAAGSDQAQSAYQMFLACENLKSVGNVILGDYCINTQKMFDGDSKLESIGVLDCLKNATNVSEMFKGCTKLTSVRFASLPNADITLDLTPCPLDADTLTYMAENANSGSATINFSATTKACDNYATVKAALEAKGYTIG